MAALTVLFVSTWTGTSLADSWNDRTRLRFSGPVMVPGATLPAGEYVFELMDLKANRHMVRIRNAEGSEVMAVASAVPIKRQEPEGTTTLTFNPTVAGAPPALKAWYYPGSIYGHEFIYSENEARMIAQRDKTIVLSEDRASGDADAAGTVRQYDATGKATNWRADDAVIREWTTWSRDAVARARTATDAAGSRETKSATTSLVDSAGTAMRVRLDDLESRPRDYTGKTISVDAEVEKVLGPRLFTIDEPDWADLDGEILVHVPTALAALVRPDDRVTITGTLRSYPITEFDREWRWYDSPSEAMSGWARRPVLVATRVVGGDDDRALLITTEGAGSRRHLLAVVAAPERHQRGRGRTAGGSGRRARDQHRPGSGLLRGDHLLVMPPLDPHAVVRRPIAHHLPIRGRPNRLRNAVPVGRPHAAPHRGVDQERLVASDHGVQTDPPERRRHVIPVRQMHAAPQRGVPSHVISRDARAQPLGSGGDRHGERRGIGEAGERIDGHR
nr:hypothetical protein [Luteitalea sp. TBR-22]